MATTGITSPSSFTGSSSFSTQLQQVITNAVSMASAPIQQLETQQTKLTGQQSELETLQSDFQSLQTSFDSFSDATGLGAYSANSSDSSVATATLSSGVIAGDYSVTVLGIGSQTNTISADSLQTVTDPTSGNIDNSSSYTLTVNGQVTTIKDADGSLSGLVQALNESGANIQSTIVNVGSFSSPDYRLSIQSADYAPDSIQLSDGTNNLLTNLTTGSYASYQVNGEPAAGISSTSRTADISPGLSVQLLQTGSTSLTISQNASGVANALTSFVSAYNSIVNDLNKNRGQNGGALTGDSVVYTLQNQLEQLANYSGASGTVSSTASLGLTFNDSGELQFNASTFDAAANTSSSDVLSFLGSPTSAGFLQAANNMLSSVTDPTSGTLTEASNSISSQLSGLGAKISDDQAQVTQLQTTLTTQMAQADAAISALEQQVNEVSTLFSDMQENEKENDG